MKLKSNKLGQIGSTNIILIIAGFIAALVISVIVFAVNTYNTATREENGIVAVHEDMKNVHASIFNTMKSQGLSIEKYGETVIKALDAAMGKRYGNDGVRGAMVWIKEQNPTIDSSLYAKLQTVIEAGYTRFESTQRTKIDRIRVYDNLLDSFFQGTIARLFGFPKKVTADMRTTISTAETKTTFETKEMKTIDPFAK